MDLAIHKPQAVCSRSGRGLVPGETFYSAVVRTGGVLERIDVAAECWSGPPEGALAWWRSAYPQAAVSGPELAPVDVLLDVLDELAGRPDDEPLRYLLALQLLRRRVLRLLDDSAPDELRLACRKRECEYRVRSVPAERAATPDVESRLTALLWSGAAA